jgi:hypothetical protein
METLFLNQKNIVEGSNNSVLTYNFKNGVNFNKGTRISLKSLTMFYSWFNIDEKSYNNNKFQYKWWGASGDLDETFTVTIPDGNYSIETINEALQFELLKNKHYVEYTVSGKTSNFYFIEFVSNPALYKYQINLYYMPTNQQNIDTYNYTKPTGATWNFPTIGSTSQIIVMSSNNFKKLIGFSSGTYPSTLKTTKQAIVGDLIPEIDPVSSIMMTCSIVNQKFSTPSTYLYSFTNNASQFGGLLDVQPYIYSWCNVGEGQYDNMTISFYDQNGNTIKILDPQMNIALVIEQQEEPKK